MKFHKPELIPLLFILCATLVLSGLGLWQLQRLQWKQQMIAQVEKMQATEPLEALPDAQAQSLEFSTVRLRGRFLHDKEIHKTSKYHGNKVGYHILTPLETYDHGTAESQEPVVVLVNRGWVPAELKEREKRPDTVAEENVIAVGLLVNPQRKNIFLPDNDVKNNVWLYDDMAQMSEFSGETLFPMMVVATGNQKIDHYPIPSDGVIKLRNDHLGYAITWFTLAIIGLIMFAFYYRKQD
ncbi:MAG: SURF1 family protein [Alphaproteobacteria bacterium]